MDFDYYQIKGKWNAATVSRRADKLEEAERAADELEEAGAVGVEIVGVKAGKRETLRGKRAKKVAPAKTTAKKKKAYTVPKMKVKEQEKKKPKKDVRKIEKAAQLDLFEEKKKDEIWRFELGELNFIYMALKEFFPKYIKEPLKLTTKEYDDLINCFERAKNRGGNININLNENETKNIIRALMWFKKQEHVYNKEYIQEIIDGLYHGNYMV